MFPETKIKGFKGLFIELAIYPYAESEIHIIALKYRFRYEFLNSYPYPPKIDLFYKSVGGVVFLPISIFWTGGGLMYF